MNNIRVQSTPLKKILVGVPSLIDVQVHKTMIDATAKFLEAFVDSFFEFLDQSLLPSQGYRRKGWGVGRSPQEGLGF
ncbi:hypothetical protein DEO72_LG7g1518 [Vigna unguiculata]|uniref:Uncharacterized protein n=1 Tax=Vigna unguiculata TaxID=3917 RepID=A0A4D6MFM5_VIGUN|nr:hypothetical protein DEO72_LG7g1518 [Vigna unguiculata]